MTETIYEILLRHEGIRRKPYLCTSGKLTIGVGRNLEDTGISDGEAFLFLQTDVNRVRKSLDKYLPWWSEQPEPVRLVMQNMAFQLGVTGLLAFKCTLNLLQLRRYPEAAKEMLISAWAKQTPKRACELASLVAAQINEDAV